MKTPLEPDVVERVALTEALEDCRTHREAWRRALRIAMEKATVLSPDIDDRSYWYHEGKAFDRVFDALARAAISAQSPQLEELIRTALYENIKTGIYPEQADKAVRAIMAQLEGRN